ncbi:MAG TPA: TetR/AcrR family transcriptional regulator [Rhizomicrobium sp.]|jgi:AcrR family transcriptional regulator|nr:TetR/AcrR family transcriptional regulator [Rhizomicrobium sp.]
MAEEKRRYSGQSFEDRQTDRRARLVRAALDVAGRFGLEGTSVAAICAEAGLTARYFYESFPSRDAIFVEAYRMAQDELLEDIAAHIDKRDPVASALTGFFAVLESHRGPARVFLLDLDDHGPAMKAASREAGEKFAQLFAPRAKDALQIAGTLGAILQIAKRWIAGGFAEPVANVVAAALPFTKVK